MPIVLSLSLVPYCPLSVPLACCAYVLQLPVQIKTSRNLVKNHSAKQIRNIQICTVSFVLALRIREIEETPKTKTHRERGRVREGERKTHKKQVLQTKGKQSAQNGIDQPSEQPLGQQQQQTTTTATTLNCCCCCWEAAAALVSLAVVSCSQLAVLNCSQFSVNFS